MSTKRVFLGFIILVFAFIGCFAQEKPQILINLAHNDGRSGDIELIQSEQMERLLMMQIANNRQQNGIPGYRILIFSQSGQAARQRADEARVSFMRNFPNMEAYPEYNLPNFQVFVGDFRTKTEALRERKNIEKTYPRAFIVNAIIDISK